MKKLFIILVLLLLACGCAKEDNIDAKLSDAYDTVYFEYDGKRYTKNEVFQRLKAQSVESSIEALVAKQTLDADGYDFDAKKEEYESQYDMIISMYGEDITKQYYGEKEDFVKLCQINDAPNIYINNYIDTRLTTFIEKYPTQYIEYISTTDKEKAEKFHKLVSKKSTFDEAFEKVEFEQSEGVTKKVVLISDETVFPDTIKDEYKKLEVNKVSEILENKQENTAEGSESTDETETTIEYFIIRVISQDAQNDYKDDFVSFVKQQEAITSVFDIFEEDHTVNFYDDDFMYTYNKLTK